MPMNLIIENTMHEPEFVDGKPECPQCKRKVLIRRISVTWYVSREHCPECQYDGGYRSLITGEPCVFGNAGFTLIELLVCILIIGLISIIALPTIVTALQERQVIAADQLVQAVISGARKDVGALQPSKDYGCLSINGKTGHIGWVVNGSFLSLTQGEK